MKYLFPILFLFIILSCSYNKSITRYENNHIKVWSISDVIYIQSDCEGKVIICDMMGREIRNIEINNDTNTVIIDNLNTYYVVKVFTCNESSTSKVYLK